MTSTNTRRRASWIDSANASDCPFPIQNLPYGVFRPGEEEPRCGVAIGDFILDLQALESEGLLPIGANGPVFAERALNNFMSRGKEVWAAVRARLTELLGHGGDPTLRDDAQLRERTLVAQAAATMQMPFRVAGYTDFYAGRHHATNVGTIFRGPDKALPPNWLSIPIGYNGRASTVVVSGTPIRRPLGQTKPPGVELPVFGPSGSTSNWKCSSTTLDASISISDLSEGRQRRRKCKGASRFHRGGV